MRHRLIAFVGVRDAQRAACHQGMHLLAVDKHKAVGDRAAVSAALCLLAGAGCSSDTNGCNADGCSSDADVRQQQRRYVTDLRS
jgi:hypothetical protein